MLTYFAVGRAVVSCLGLLERGELQDDNALHFGPLQDFVMTIGGQHGVRKCPSKVAPTFSE